LKRRVSAAKLLDSWTPDALYALLSEKAAVAPRKPRPVETGPPPVLAAVSQVIEEAEQPMRASESHMAAEQLAGRPFLRTSVKAALAAGTGGQSP